MGSLNKIERGNDTDKRMTENGTIGFQCRLHTPTADLDVLKSPNQSHDEPARR